MTSFSPPNQIERLRTDVLSLFQEAVRAADPASAVAQALRERLASLAGFKRVFVIAFGKAAVQMTRAALPFFADKLAGAIVVTNAGNAAPVGAARVIAAGHPIPDEKSLEAAAAIEQMVAGAGEGDLVVCLISGGGSALVCAPAAGISLADKVRLNEALIRCGADIREINGVRRAVSRLKGGRLARLAAPAEVLSLIVSDVPGDDVDIIASGPTGTFKATTDDALETIEKFGLGAQLAPALLNHLRAGTGSGGGAVVPANTQNVIVGSNTISRAHAAALARRHFERVVVDEAWLEGDVGEVAVRLCALARDAARLPPATALIFGGEPTVMVAGQGKGGRNQELALRFSLQCEAKPIDRAWVFLSGGTDGRDGPTDAAGAVVDVCSLDRMRQRGFDVLAALRNNDSYPPLSAVGDLLMTGSTGTNVADIQIVLIGAPLDGADRNPQ